MSDHSLQYDEANANIRRKRNYLDRASITQAYVSGMREDLGFKGAQLTEVTTLYATAYLMSVD